MTTQEQIQFIRQKAIEANPEILKLEFGCAFRLHNKKFYVARYLEDVETLVDENNIHWTLTQLKQLQFAEIIGRDIRLADVLFTIEKTGKDIEVSLYQNTCHIGRYSEGKKEGYYSYCLYDLLKDRLEDQSPETIEFIYNLLK